jgi:hypothetical protein
MSNILHYTYSMSENKTCICQYCIANINEVGTISEAEYAVASNSHSCTFCFCEYPEPFVLKDDSLENITRLKKLLNESSDKYEHNHNYH